ncbi:hypothetical protein ACUNWD_18670 [Sunxiuqinia sp. A32]|uniref:hypothetical protein n=1 Tax=Sunxiuqinia sp. A32 TaxID=3461496 RepID=UPI004045D88A
MDDVKSYKTNKKRFFTRLQFRCGTYRFFGKYNNAIDEALKNIKTIDEFRNNNMPELTLFTTFYARKVQGAIKNSTINPSKLDSKKARENNQLVDFLNRYRSNPVGKIDSYTSGKIRKKLRTTYPIDKITFHEKSTNDKVSINNFDLIPKIIFVLIDSEEFDDKLKEFTNSKRSSSYYVELYKSLAPVSLQPNLNFYGLLN